MSADRFDVVVIGAGIHGAGVAQAAAAAGHTVLVLEKSQTAAGTSSRSSKLIHGGLRYLESGHYALVRESLYERELLLRNAPGLVRLVPFYVPVYERTTRRPWQLRVGLSLYAVLGNFAPSTRFGTLPRSVWRRLSDLRLDGLQEVFTYLDAQTDDAKLTRAVVASAVTLGAQLRAPARLVAAGRNDGGYRITYTQGGTARECEATVIVNAAGPWINAVQSVIEPQPPAIDIDLVQGTHLLFDKPLSAGVFYVEASADRRAVFIMPWHGGMLIGTTETPFHGDPDAVAPRPEEVEYLSGTLRAYFPRYDGERTEAIAGLRVLPRGPGSTFRRSRETLLLPDDPAAVHLIAIYGGKLTTYRATAEKVMRMIRPSLPVREPRADTRTLALGADS